MKALTPKVPRGRGLYKFNSIDIDWYMRMPTDQSLADPKDEIQPELCQEADATQEPTEPERDSFHIEMHAGIKVIPYFLARFKMWHINLERKVEIVPS